MSSRPWADVSIDCGGRCCDPVHLEFDVIDHLTSPTRRVVDEDRILDIWTLIGDIQPEGTLSKFHCRVFDKETGKCGEYDKRPAICSGYPYGRACNICGMGAELKSKEVDGLL